MKQNINFFFIFIPFFLFACTHKTEKEINDDEYAPVLLSYQQKTQVPHLGYKNIIPELKIENLVLGETGNYGATGDFEKAIRTLRFENITDAVEKKYHLPSKILLAMIFEESTGVDLLPNGRDDGGFGLIHMQPSLAKEFGLKRYKNCNELRCVKHGKELEQLILSKNQDRKRVYMLDDRLHPIKNIDCAGRMLTWYAQRPPSDYTCFEAMILRYAGRYNYRQYIKDIRRNMKLLKSEVFRGKIEKYFNERNADLRINGKKADFEDYISQTQSQAINYGLTEY